MNGSWSRPARSGSRSSSSPVVVGPESEIRAARSSPSASIRSPYHDGHERRASPRAAYSIRARLTYGSKYWHVDERRAVPVGASAIARASSSWPWSAPTVTIWPGWTLAPSDDGEVGEAAGRSARSTAAKLTHASASHAAWRAREVPADERRVVVRGERHGALARLARRSRRDRGSGRGRARSSWNSVRTTTSPFASSSERMSTSGSSRVWDGSRARSKRSSSTATSGSIGAIWSTTSTCPPKPGDARELGDDELRARDVVERARAAGEVERAPPARSRRVTSPSTNVTFGNGAARGRASSSSVGLEVDGDDLGDVRGERRTRARRCRCRRRARARRPTAGRSAGRALSGRRGGAPRARRSAPAVLSPAISSDKLQRLLSRRDRACCALLGDQLEQPPDLRAGREAELVAAQQRLARARARGRARLHRRARRRPRKASASSAHGSVARRKRWIARGESSAGGSRAEQRVREAAQARSRSAAARSRSPNVTASRYSGESNARSRGDQRCRRAARAGRARPGARTRRPRAARSSSRIALAGRLRRRARASLADELLRLGVEAEAELVLEPHGAQQAQRVVVEDARRDDADDAALEVGPPAERIDGSPPASGTAIALIVKSRVAEVGLDRAALERREVDGPPVVERDPPARRDCSESGKTAPPRARAKRAGGPLGLAAGDVEVEHGPAEQLVADRAADDPGLLAAAAISLGQLSASTTVRRARSGSSRSRRRARR